MTYDKMFEKYPLLGHRLHTLHCESCKPMGVQLSIIYHGDDRDGAGEVKIVTLYGSIKKYKITVRDGWLYAFGLRQDLRKPTKLRTSTGVSDYGEKEEFLLKDNRPVVKKREKVIQS